MNGECSGRSISEGTIKVYYQREVEMKVGQRDADMRVCQMECDIQNLDNNWNYAIGLSYSLLTLEILCCLLESIDVAVVGTVVKSRSFLQNSMGWLRLTPFMEMGEN